MGDADPQSRSPSIYINRLCDDKLNKVAGRQSKLHIRLFILRALVLLINITAALQKAQLHAYPKKFFPLLSAEHSQSLATPPETTFIVRTRRRVL
jgi:hypothetical protein